MGAFDGAQVSDLVGLYILSIIKDELPQLDFALYRDDGIAQHKKLKPQAIDKIRKKLHKIFNDLGLTITVETTLNRVNFLDVTMNLHQNSYEPFRKPNNTPLYINIESNHPPHVKKNIPIAVNKRLTMLSSSQKLFDTHKEEYQVALKKSGYTHDMTYGNPDARNKTMQKSNETTERSQITVENSTATAPDPRPPTSSDPSPADISQLTNSPPSSLHTSPAHHVFTPPPCTPNDLRNQSPNSNPATTNDNDNTQPRRSQRLRSKRNAELNASTESTQSNSLNNHNEVNQKNKQPKIATVHTNTNNLPEKPKKKNRKRNITFWNPPFNISLSTNIGKQFLNLINKHFPANSDLSSAFNRHTIKISYSTTQNISDIIAAHNKKILNRKLEQEAEKCNCRNECPIPGKCREKAVVYQAEINGALYIGMTKTEVRSRIRRHRHSFKAPYKKNDTSLSNFIWNKKININENDEIVEPNIKWSVLKKCHEYQPGQKNCDLCLSEKYLIIKNQKNPKCINKKSDISNKCFHKKSFYYSELKSDLSINIDVIT